jgi:hypothetical protein
VGLRRIPYVSFIIKDPGFKVSLKTGLSNPPSSSDYRVDINFNLIIKLMEVNFQTLVFFNFYFTYLTAQKLISLCLIKFNEFLF